MSGRRDLTEEEADNIEKVRQELGKQRFVDAAADSLETSVREAARGYASLQMCREEGKGGDSIGDDEMKTLEGILIEAQARARWINSRIKGEK